MVISKLPGFFFTMSSLIYPHLKSDRWHNFKQKLFSICQPLGVGSNRYKIANCLCLLKYKTTGYINRSAYKTKQGHSSLAAVLNTIIILYWKTVRVIQNYFAVSGLKQMDLREHWCPFLTEKCYKYWNTER